MKNNKLAVSDHPLFGCTGCGHCMAVCPSHAIEISRREISVNDLIDLSEMKDKSNYDQLKNLMVRRRSIRDFKDRPISDEMIEKIIEAAVSAPMGLPPSDVQLIVFKGKDKVREFSFDVIDYFNKISWVFSKQFIWIWRLFGKEAYQLMKSFGNPLEIGRAHV